MSNATKLGARAIRSVNQLGTGRLIASSPDNEARMPESPETPDRVSQQPQLGLDAATEIVRESVASVRTASVLQALERLLPDARIMVAGGVLRNAILRTVRCHAIRSNDLDLVIFGLPVEHDLMRQLASLDPDRTSYGGARFVLEGVPVDCWSAELQLEVAGASRRPIEPGEFVEYVTLSTDAVLCDLAGSACFGPQFIETFNSRRVHGGARCSWIDPWIGHHLAHLAFVCSVTGFAIGHGLSLYLQTVLRPDHWVSAEHHLRKRNRGLESISTLRDLRAVIHAGG